MSEGNKRIVIQDRKPVAIIDVDLGNGREQELRIFDPRDIITEIRAFTKAHKLEDALISAMAEAIMQQIDEKSQKRSPTRASPSPIPKSAIEKTQSSSQLKPDKQMTSGSRRDPPVSTGVTKTTESVAEAETKPFEVISPTRVPVWSQMEEVPISSSLRIKPEPIPKQEMPNGFSGKDSRAVSFAPNKENESSLRLSKRPSSKRRRQEEKSRQVFEAWKTLMDRREEERQTNAHKKRTRTKTPELSEPRTLNETRLDEMYRAGVTKETRRRSRSNNRAVETEPSAEEFYDFRPHINPVSARMVTPDAKGRKREQILLDRGEETKAKKRLAKARKDQLEAAECSFTPTVNAVSLQYANQRKQNMAEGQGEIHERLYDEAEEFRSRRDQLVEVSMKKTCPFTPELLRRTEELAQVENGKTSFQQRNVFEKLHYEAKRRELVKTATKTVYRRNEAAQSPRPHVLPEYNEHFEYVEDFAMTDAQKRCFWPVMFDCEHNSTSEIMNTEPKQLVKARKLFDELDRNHDGLFTSEDAKHIPVQLARGLPIKLLTVQDRFGFGLNYAEFLQILLGRGLLDSVLLYYDEFRSGKTSAL